MDHSDFSEMESISEGSTLSSQTSDNRKEADEIGNEQTNGPGIFMTQVSIAIEEHFQVHIIT